MVVLLVATMFILFVIADAVLERRQRRAMAHETATRHAKLREQAPSFVAGYELPEELHYHKGHTWVHWVAPDEAYVGVDDFGRRLIGQDAQVKAPHRGSWVHQGENAVKLNRGGETVDLVSPLTGEIVGINPELHGRSEALHDDAYGKGWLYKIKAADLHTQIRNLFSGSLARCWMEDSRDRFQRQLMLATGNVIQDGGTPVDDIAAHLSPAQWHELAEEFFSVSSSPKNQ
jgi:glycine cleavage system H protein